MVYDCSIWQPAFVLFQVEYQGQTRYTRTPVSKPLINTFYRIRHRLELNFFHFAQILLNLIEQLIDLEKVRTDNLKFRTDLRDRKMDGWSLTQQMIVCQVR